MSRKETGQGDDDAKWQQVPADFPRQPYKSALSSAHPKLSLVEYNGRYYYPGATPPEVWQRWDVCEDLAQQFSRKCVESKAGKRSHMAPEDIVEQYLERLLKTGWVSEPEGHWVMRRAAELIHWPLPNCLQSPPG